MTISIISCRLIIAAKMIFHSPLSKSAHSCIIKQGGVNVQANMQYYLSKNVGMVCNRCVQFLIFNKCWVFFVWTVCGDKIVKNGNKLTEKLDKLNEVYNQVIASSNLLTKVRGVTFSMFLFMFLKKMILFTSVVELHCVNYYLSLSDFGQLIQTRKVVINRLFKKCQF